MLIPGQFASQGTCSNNDNCSTWAVVYYMFFFTNLKENVAARTAAWSAGQEADIILSDDSSSFVLLSEAVPDAILEIRYYSTYNFVGDRIEGYEEPLEEEWWHFTLEDEPYPNTYFTFPINSDSLDDAA